MDLAKYTGELTDCEPSRQLSVREQLEVQKTRTQEKLQVIEAALTALDENPGVEKVLTLVGRTVRF